MKFILKYVLRSLCFVVDCVVVIVPIQYIFIGLFHSTGAQLDLLLQAMFVVYNICLLQLGKGQSFGKKLGKLKVVMKDGALPTISQYAMREIVKGIYFTPVFGWILGMVSFCMMVFGRGNTIHDYVAQTKVIFQGTSLEEATQNGSQG